jgi:hypothetical protein
MMGLVVGGLKVCSLSKMIVVVLKKVEKLSKAAETRTFGDPLRYADLRCYTR